MSRSAGLPHKNDSSYALRWPAAFIGVLAGVALNAGPVTAIGLGLVGFTAAWYLMALGEEIAIVPLAGFIASAQWVLGPVIAYRQGDPFAKYRMYVPEAEYMEFVVPALVAFIVALGWTAPRIPLQGLQAQILGNRSVSERVVIGLIVVGLVADYVAGATPGGLAFVFFLLGQFKYVGAIYLVVIRSRHRWRVAGAVMLLTAISSARIGLFHDLILWSAMIFTFFCYDFRLKTWNKLVIIVASVAILVGLQSVKAEYRNLLLSNPEGAGFITLMSSIGQAVLGGRETQFETDDVERHVRLNQGWIISAVMAHTPSGEPFAGGETVIDAIRDSLLPRFLVAKREVVVSDYFRRFAGMSVGEHTSFGISIVGEAWANFGEFGILLLVFWGVAFGCAMRLIAWRSRYQPTFALWTPLIFLYSVKAETELLVALNHMVKAGIFVALVYALSWRILRIRI